MSGSARFLVKLGVSLGLLYFILSVVPLSDILGNLRDTRPWPALAGLALMPVMFYLLATQTRVLATQQGMSLSVGQIFRISFITNFYGLFLPGTLAGGVIRWYKYARVDNKPIEALATIAFGRLLNTLVAVALGMLCWALDNTARQDAAVGASLGVVLALLVFIYWLFSHQDHARQLATKLDARAYVPALVRSATGRILRAASEFHRLPVRRILSISVVLLIYHLLGIASYVLFSRALEIDTSVISLGWIRTAVLLVILIPVSIGGLGIREGGLIYMLHAYGVSPALAVALSLLLFGRKLLAGAIGAIFEMWDVLGQRGSWLARRLR
ncbi:MAG: flippase-like domain-containing protein [Gammaproteobacteria bacterium]|nr:flippase-like domain-containing protein [Gammaproteobacteria bacterium]